MPICAVYVYGVCNGHWNIHHEEKRGTHRVGCEDSCMVPNFLGHQSTVPALGTPRDVEKDYVSARGHRVRHVGLLVY